MYNLRRKLYKLRRKIENSSAGDGFLTMKHGNSLLGESGK